jgi:hypothetical protein
MKGKEYRNRLKVVLTGHEKGCCLKKDLVRSNRISLI